MSGTAFVYLETENEKIGKEYKLHSPDTLTRSKLCNLSSLAAKRLGWGQGTGKHELVLDGKIFDGAAVKKILNAMLYNNIHQPTPLTVNGLRITSIAELIHIYAAANTLKLVRPFKSDDLRATIIEGIKKGPLKFVHFKQIVEALDFDTALTKTAKHHVMYVRVKSGDSFPPGFTEIRQYCMMHNAEYGLWDEMEAIRVEINQKMEKQAKEDARRKAVVKEETFDRDFPALPGKKS